MFSDFNTTWIEFIPRERDNSLVLEFPKAHLISNGERDVLCFIALLQRAKKKLKKENNILIIDEVFDYLDDANLIAVQYYITQFIEDYNKNNKRIYPLILTHIDSIYFRGHVFGKKHKIQVCYLDKSEAVVSPSLIKILKERNNGNSIVKPDIEKYLLHYHTEQINRRADFERLELKPTWGEHNNFDNYIYEEARKYYEGEPKFDPLAVCCSVRKRIEKNVYDLILDANSRNTFLNEKSSGTNEKLDFAEDIGVQVKETYYYLGIIYNNTLHWKEDRDNISPVMAKLNNKIIKKLIKTIFE